MALKELIIIIIITITIMIPILTILFIITSIFS